MCVCVCGRTLSVTRVNDKSSAVRREHLATSGTTAVSVTIMHPRRLSDVVRSPASEVSDVSIGSVSVTQPVV